MDLNKLYQAKAVCLWAIVVQIIMVGIYVVFSVRNSKPVNPGQTVFIKTPHILDYTFWITAFLIIFISFFIKTQESREKKIKENMPIDRI